MEALIKIKLDNGIQLTDQESVCFDELTGDDYTYFREKSYNDWFELYKKQTSNGEK